MYRYIFLVVLLSLLYLAQRYWLLLGWRVIGAIQTSTTRYVLQALWAAAALGVVAAVLDPMFGRVIPRQGFGHWVLTASRLWLAASLVAFLAITAIAAAEWLSRSAQFALSATQWNTVDPARRAFFRYAAYLAGGIPFVAATYGFGTERLRYRVERVEVPVTNLPKALDGFRIVQLSDIHGGDFMPPVELRRAVDIANELRPDLAVVTGDVISSVGDPLEECVAELSRLRAPLGTWGCNGNHEIYAEVEDEAQLLFQRYGMRLLRDRNAELAWRGERINLIGVDYQRARSFSGERLTMLRGIESLVRRDVPNILLSHNPNSFPRAAELGIELSLAGHTHGGAGSGGNPRPQVESGTIHHRLRCRTVSPAFEPGGWQRKQPTGLSVRESRTGHVRHAGAVGRAAGNHAADVAVWGRNIMGHGLPDLHGSK